MSETTPAPIPSTVPPLTINVQYVKDLSFEVPSAPQVYSTLRSQPQVNINLDVQVRRLTEGQDVFEVTLAVKAEAFDPNAPPNEPRDADFHCRARLWRVVHADRDSGERDRAGAAGGMPAAAVSVCAEYPG